MKTSILHPVVILTLGCSVMSFASTMSPEKSKCFALETAEKEHAAWKTEFRRFNERRESLSPDLQHRASLAALKQISDRLREVKQISEISAHEKVIADANRLVGEIDSKKITSTAAAPRLKSMLADLEDAMSDLIFRAQAKYDCAPEAHGAPIKTPSTFRTR